MSLNCRLNYKSYEINSLHNLVTTQPVVLEMYKMIVSSTEHDCTCAAPIGKIILDFLLNNTFQLQSFVCIKTTRILECTRIFFYEQ